MGTSLPKLSKLIPPSTHLLLQTLHFSSTPQNYNSTLPKALTSTTLITAIQSQPDANSAVHLFRRASRQKNFHHTSSTYAHIISKLGMAGKFEQMNEFLHEMVKFQFPDAAFSFQYLVENFCISRMFNEALKVLEIACFSKVRMSVMTYNVVLKALVEERLSIDKVVFVYKEMVKCGVLPNVDTLNFLIKCLVENGMVELAMSQFDRMEEKNCAANSLTFEILICGLCCNERVGDAVRIWNEMLESECCRDRSFYVNLIPMFCRVCRLDEAVTMFWLMKGDGFVPDLCLYGVMIDHLCQNLRVGDVIKVFEEMQIAGYTANRCMLVDIVNMYCKLGEFSEAVNFVDRNNVSDNEPYNTLLQSLCAVDKFQEATQHFKRMQDIGMSDVHSWNILIKYFCNKGNVGKAFEVLGRMIVSSCLPNEATYSSMITGFCKECAYNRALDWFWQGLGKNMSYDSESCSEFIEGLCQIGKVEDAVEVFYCIINRGRVLHSDSLNTMVKKLVLMGKVNEAVKLRSIALCNGTARTSSTYEIILVGLVDLNKGKFLLPLLSQMLIEGLTLDAGTYNILICGLSVKNTTCALQLFNQMVKDDFIPDSTTLEKLVFHASKSSKLHLVVQSLDKIIGGTGLDNPTVCNMIIYGLISEGCKDEACKFLDWMLERGWVPDSDTHGLLIGNVNGGGKHEIKDAYEDGDGVSIILSEGLGDIR